MSMFVTLFLVFHNPREIIIIFVMIVSLWYLQRPIENISRLYLHYVDLYQMTTMNVVDCFIQFEMSFIMVTLKERGCLLKHFQKKWESLSVCTYMLTDTGLPLTSFQD